MKPDFLKTAMRDGDKHPPGWSKEREQLRDRSVCGYRWMKGAVPPKNEAHNCSFPSSAPPVAVRGGIHPLFDILRLSKACLKPMDGFGPFLARTGHSASGP